ncbi:Excinuclease ABC subunit C [Planctomycetales bacterium 10988]|nr:Excinuclease ABC subunit C [Planctomycetales bacterium 10988]
MSTPGLFAQRRFHGFGRSLLEPTSRTPDWQEIQGNSWAQLREGVCAEAENQSGVYGMLDDDDQLLYVGKSKQLRTRLLSYFRAKDPQEKAHRILDRTRTIVWEETSDEFCALLRELELIRRFQPPMNVQGQPQRQRRVFLCLGRSPAPYFYLSKELNRRTLAHFGPFRPGLRLQEVVRHLNNCFQLRDCSDSQPLQFADQQQLFPILQTPGCLRYEIGTCSGPCMAAVTRKQYEKRILKAQAFLHGLDEGILEQIEKKMTAASVACQFEKATVLRDKMIDLRWIKRHLKRLDTARQHFSFIYNTTDTKSARKARWIYLHRGQVVAVLPAPRGPRQAETAFEQLYQTYGDPTSEQSKSPEPMGPASGIHDDIDALWLAVRWFNQNPEELQQTLTPLEALNHCQERLQKTKRFVVPKKPK